MNRTPRLFTVLGFATTHDALAAEKHLKAADVPVVPIPTPRALGARCGIALRIPLDDESRADEVLLEKGPLVHSRTQIEDV